MNKKTHPIEEGWLHATLTMSKGTIDENAVKNIMTGGKIDDYDFPLFQVKGRTIKAIYRRKIFNASLN